MSLLLGARIGTWSYGGSKPYDYEVEWIQGRPGSYIFVDAGFETLGKVTKNIVTADHPATLEAKIERTTDGENSTSAWCGFSNPLRFMAPAATTAANRLGLVQALGKSYNLSLDSYSMDTPILFKVALYDNSANGTDAVFYSNGEEVASYSGLGSTAMWGPNMLVFGYGSASTSSTTGWGSISSSAGNIKLYYIKSTVNGVSVDLIPVVKGGKAYLYDRISGGMWGKYSACTGDDFPFGPEVG